MRLAAGDTRYNSLNSFFNTTFGNKEGSSHSSGGAGMLTLTNRRGSESHLPGSSIASSSSSASRTAVAMANLVSPGRTLSMTNMNLSISLSRSVDPFSQLHNQSSERERGLVPEATPKQPSLTPSTSSNKLNPSGSAFKLVLK
jgi:hypothetical protein